MHKQTNKHKHTNKHTVLFYSRTKIKKTDRQRGRQAGRDTDREKVRRTDREGGGQADGYLESRSSETDTRRGERR